MSENIKISVHMFTSVKDATELGSLFESLIEAYPDNMTVKALYEICKVVQTLPSVIEQHDAERLINGDGDDDDDEPMDMDRLQFPNTTLTQNWKMN